jgi:GrpB-like predicted nucleotidyltransferase (UPF0157 family)
MSIIIPYAILPPHYVEYDPAAPDVAAIVATLIEKAAPWAKVEHIGSTAAPNCAGKGIVDLMAMYPEGSLAEMRDVLERLRFQRQQTGHAFPEDRPMRVGAIEYQGRVYRLHVHVVAADSEEVASLRRFRDILRTDSKLCDAYQAKKRAILQSGTHTSGDYTQAKGEFISAVMSERG